MPIELCEVPNCIMLKNHKNAHSYIKYTKSTTNWLYDMWKKYVR